MGDPVIETAGIAKLTDPRLDVRDEEQFAKEHADGAAACPWNDGSRPRGRQSARLTISVTRGLSSRRLGFARTARP